jgi:peroxiredoxin
MSKKSGTRPSSEVTRRTTKAPKESQMHTRQRAREQRLSTGRRRLTTLVATIGAAVGILAAIFYVSNGGSNGGGQAYAFEVADPKPGAVAPPLRLTAVDGSTYDLAEHRGKTILLYFQEGIGCQPCWDQLRDVEANLSALKGLGIDEIVTVTSDPLDLLRQKGADEGLTTPLLSDPDLSVSATYGGNVYGMMGNAKNGHSFILVDRDGVIRWRADYGGPPKYTMYVPVQHLIADIREGLAKDGAGGPA